MMRLVPLASTLLLVAVVAIGCDKEKTRDAADTAGEKVKEAVVTVGDASHDAAANAGKAMEKAGEKIQEVAHDNSTTRPTTMP